MCLCLAALLLLSGCGAGAREELSIVDDKYRNWYEIFVYSFRDSDGDGIGDLNGVTEKLDYIAGMGFDGIWLMPIMPSPSYHKYDVTDYYNVDPQYGTLEDMGALLSAAHERGIKVIIDLPVNHSSDQHPWFVSAAAGDSEYRDYYNWSDTAKSGYNKLGDQYYESRFTGGMPDLNLDNPELRAEIRNILRFWLQEVGVDGFRLDAVTSYYTGAEQKNIEFLSWLGRSARELSPDCFIVAEAWDSLEVIASYSRAEIDSFFTFPVSQKDGYIAKVLSDKNDSPGESYGSYVTLLENTLPENSIPAPFIENHDTARAIGFLGRSSAEKQKMGAALLAMMRGGVFVYYGQEIGMAGSGEDPNKRIGMFWSAGEDTTSPPPGASKLEYPLPPVDAQQADENSLLNFYRSAIELRNRFPEIARGSSELLDSGSGDVCLILRTWGDRSIIIALNPSASDHDIQAEIFTQYPGLGGQLACGENAPTMEGGKLHLPAWSVAILTA